MILYVATALFATTFLLGLLVQFRFVDSSGFRWLHHALFFVVIIATAVAVGWGIFQGKAYGFVLIPALVIYYFLPRIRAGTPGHAALAVSALIFYVLAFVITL